MLLRCVGVFALLATRNADTATTVGSTAPDPDALWQIVSTCIGTQSTNYCTCPIFSRSCCGDTATPDADVVLATTREFVAIRDMKTCGCPDDLVAALAIPRARVTGIEDPARPEGIWAFAWDVGRSRIKDDDAIALVINPRSMRTQNQFHIHILRIRPDARTQLERLDVGPSGRGMLIVPVADLGRVFAAVVSALGTDQIGDRGILVMRAPDDGTFRAVVTDHFSPELFAISKCR